MKDLDDEEIQRIIEDQLKFNRLPEDIKKDGDAELYRILFIGLAEDHSDTLNYCLADKVGAQIQKRQDRREGINYSFLILVIVLLIGCLIGEGIELANNTQLKALGQWVVNHKTILLFILFAFFVIQVLDRYLKRNDRFVNRQGN